VEPTRTQGVLTGVCVKQSMNIISNCKFKKFDTLEFMLFKVISY